MVYASFTAVMLLTIAIWFMYRFYLYTKNKNLNLLRECLLLLFLIYFLILLKITIFKSDNIVFHNQFTGYAYQNYGIFGVINIIPLKETISTLNNEYVPIMMPIRNIIGNVLLFLPLGILIPILFDKYNKFSKIFVLGFVSSLSIEIVQLFVGGNVCDIDDVIFNTSGAIIGLLLYKLLRKMDKNMILNSILEKISDIKTKNIFIKSSKVISMISVLTIIFYIYCVFDQTAPSNLSNEELALRILNDSSYEVIDSCDFDDMKFYLTKDSNGLDIKSLVKYGKSRYTNSYEGYVSYSADNTGYNLGVIHKLDPSTDELHISVAVIGKNDNASKISIRLGKKDYTYDLNNNDYFLSIYPEYVKINDDELSDIYNGVNNDSFEVKFLDKNNKVVDSMDIVNY